MFIKRLIGLVAALVMLALLVPALTRAALIWQPNGFTAGTRHEPFVSWGEVTFKNTELQELHCQALIQGGIWNETEQGREEVVGYSTWGCKAPLPCEVNNEFGGKNEGTFTSDEGPPTATEVEKKQKGNRTGNTSLPWEGELTEKPGRFSATEHFVLLGHHLKLWMVVPLPKSVGGPGEGKWCELWGGEEIPLEEREGMTEKEEGDELSLRFTNGLGNGLSPSHERLTGEQVAKKTEEEKKTLPKETGRLISPMFGPTYLSGELVMSGSTDFELLLAEP